MTTSHVAPLGDLLANLLADARWARRLARALLREPDLADDLVQTARSRPSSAVTALGDRA